ncbi:tail fiber protein [Paenibacillus sp. WQ 127069]|uniref:Tail fiber protein n=1 Tax=Paenibacillus baimaensis TaxID=2982185 RepID=A0ABT2UJY0_9BACL|nr:tail fiber protein [Paenibacillus sp. WQ 127069]MCU6794336.1 tail fiber protein [Paenibacillus sp. WQ 127069]
MSDPFLAEIRLFPYARAPRGWALCNGQTLSISTNSALYSLLGTTYGGNGTTTFALPDLRGRVPVHVGTNLTLGQQGGEAGHTLNINEMPTHSHLAQGSSDPSTSVSPQNQVWGMQNNLYGPATALTPMNGTAIANTGGSQPHSNMQPYLALNYCIATQGIFPARS